LKRAAAVGLSARLAIACCVDQSSFEVPSERGGLAPLAKRKPAYHSAGEASLA
jgi:hypothetical protein